MALVDDTQGKEQMEFGEEKPLEESAAEGKKSAVSNLASGAVDVMANGANAAYEFIKDRVEEASGKDVDGDGRIGRYSADLKAGGVTAGDIAAGAELAAEAVADKAGKIVDKASNVTAGDIAAGAELAAEAVSNAVHKNAE